MLGVVCTHMNNFLKIVTDTDIIWSEAAFEDEEMVEAFTNGELDDEPTLDPMRPAWKVLNCRWNHMLAEQFVDYMIREVGRKEEERGDIRDAFAKRLVRLRTTLMTNARRDGETEKDWRERVEEEMAKDVARSRGNTRRATVSTGFSGNWNND